jgi:hypothetical protein
MAHTRSCLESICHGRSCKDTASSTYSQEQDLRKHTKRHRFGSPQPVGCFQKGGFEIGCRSESMLGDWAVSHSAMHCLCMCCFLLLNNCLTSKVYLPKQLSCFVFPHCQSRISSSYSVFSKYYVKVLFSLVNTMLCNRLQNS